MRQSSKSYIEQHIINIETCRNNWFANPSWIGRVKKDLAQHFMLRKSMIVNATLYDYKVAHVGAGVYDIWLEKRP